MEPGGAGHVHHQRADEGDNSEDDLKAKEEGINLHTVIITNGAIMLKDSSNQQERNYNQC